jgi:CNT family concentrative nucleoside transporter
MVSVGDPVQESIADQKSSKEEQGIPRISRDAEAISNNDSIGLNKIETSWFCRNHNLIRHLKLFALSALILGWWISATVFNVTRHRSIVQTFFAWSFIAIIAFRFIPNSIVTRPVEAIWIPLIQKPFFALPKYVRYGLGWLALLAIVLGSAFGFELENVRYLLNRCFFF